MAVDDRARHELHRKLEEVLGAEEAATLIHLPPVGWADVATKHDFVLLKHDLAQLEERMNLRFGSIDQRFEMVNDRFDSLEERMNLRFQAMEDRFNGKLDSLGETYKPYDRYGYDIHAHNRDVGRRLPADVHRRGRRRSTRLIPPRLRFLNSFDTLHVREA